MGLLVSIILLILPPLVVLLFDGWKDSLINILLMLLFYIPGFMHAVFVVFEHFEEKREKRKLVSNFAK